MKMKPNTIVDMKTSQFPFGQVQSVENSPKILIKKKVYYKSEKDHLLLQQKIGILKNIYHKNTINFRYVESTQPGMLCMYYNYVPYSLQSFFSNFSHCNTQIIKQIHKQLIQLVIHLAKNCLLTGFNPNRCGMVENADGKWGVKYYLPLNQIVVTSNVNMLERSVQLFTVQSLHYLDTLNQNPENLETSFVKNVNHDELRYRESFSNQKKNRRQSQPYLKQAQKQRRFSNQPSFLQFSKRKCSNQSKNPSQFSSSTHKQTNTSTLFQTLRSISPPQQLKKCDSAIYINKPNIINSSQLIEKAKETKERSKKILESFNQIIKAMKIYKFIVGQVKQLEDARN